MKIGVLTQALVNVDAMERKGLLETWKKMVMTGRYDLDSDCEDREVGREALGIREWTGFELVRRDG